MGRERDWIGTVLAGPCFGIANFVRRAFLTHLRVFTLLGFVPHVASFSVAFVVHFCHWARAEVYLSALNRRVPAPEGLRGVLLAVAR